MRLQGNAVHQDAERVLLAIGVLNIHTIIVGGVSIAQKREMRKQKKKLKKEEGETKKIKKGEGKKKIGEDGRRKKQKKRRSMKEDSKNNGTSKNNGSGCEIISIFSLPLRHYS